MKIETGQTVKIKSGSDNAGMRGVVGFISKPKESKYGITPALYHVDFANYSCWYLETELDTDTAPKSPAAITLQTKPLVIPEDVTALEGTRVLYQHFNCFRTLYPGTIEQAKVTAAGIEVYICPDRIREEDSALLSKWKNLAIDSVVELIEPDFPHPALDRLYRNGGNLAELYRIERPGYLIED